MNQVGLSLAMQILLQVITPSSDEKISPHTHLVLDVKDQQLPMALLLFREWKL
jgi:hypothetical protein